MRGSKSGLRWLLVALALGVAIPVAYAQSAPEEKAKFDLYGFAMLDMGYDFKQNDPDWYDVMRPTKLPSADPDSLDCTYASGAPCGKDGRFYSGVRQSRLGVKSYVPTKLGQLYAIFEFELFGTGVDAGQTTFRLRHAYGELGQFGAGQTWSPFMDPDVFPNSIEYWGPNGMVFFRNVQVRWMPLKGEHEVTLALERPGASGDQGIYANRVELSGISARFPYPDLTGHYRMNEKWGHVQIAGIVRKIYWDDLLAYTPGHPYDLSGNTTGWGINLSTNIKIADDTIRASVVYGEGIENYMNDAPVDVAIDKRVTVPADARGKALPVLGIVAFYDYTWSDKWTSSIGYSRVDIDNSSGQDADAFKTGQYALVNALYYPVKNVMLGPEFQWGQRSNNSDGWKVDDYRIQFSARFNFGHKFGG